MKKNTNEDMARINGMLEAVCCILVEIDKIRNCLSKTNNNQIQEVINETLSDFTTLE